MKQFLLSFNKIIPKLQEKREMLLKQGREKQERKQKCKTER